MKALGLSVRDGARRTDSCDGTGRCLITDKTLPAGQGTPELPTERWRKQQHRASFRKTELCLTGNLDSAFNLNKPDYEQQGIVERVLLTTPQIRSGIYS